LEVEEMKKMMLFSLMAAVILIAGTAKASPTGTWRFSFTSDDLMNVVTVDGVDGSTAVDNGVYDGARLYRNDGDYLHSCNEGTNDALITWMNTTDMRLVEFNIWGYDGRGANWGEEYKPMDPAWSNYGSSSSAWDTEIVDWPWGSFEDYEASHQGAYTSGLNGDLLCWDTDFGDADNAAAYANGLKFDGTSDTVTFTFDVQLNGSWYDDDLWYDGQEGQLVFWFGGYGLDGNGNWSDVYEGNMVLTGYQVPAPGALLLGSMGLGIVNWMRRRRTM
jgi:hypothetical protein